MSKLILILGCGGHARSLLDLLVIENHSLKYVVAHDEFLKLGSVELEQISDQQALAMESSNVRLINGVGSMPNSNLRRILFDRYKDSGFQFESIIATSASVSKGVTVGEGVQLLRGVLVNCGVRLGLNTIVNTGAIVEHDCIIGPHNHLASGVTLAGGVTTGANVFVGAGATIIQNISIGDNTVIGAGAVVTKNVGANKVVYSARSVVGGIA